MLVCCQNVIMRAFLAQKSNVSPLIRLFFSLLALQLYRYRVHKGYLSSYPLRGIVAVYGQLSIERSSCYESKSLQFTFLEALLVRL